MVESEENLIDKTFFGECIKLIPHKKFSFAKVWLLATRFEIRQLNLKGARLILGHAVRKAPKDKVIEKYIEMELNLGNVDRCRKLYKKYVECSPENCNAWAKYVELECSLGETERARAVFELALSQPVLDMPELLWKAIKHEDELEESLIYGEESAGIRKRSREVSERAITNTQAVSLKILEAAYRWKKQRSASEDPGEQE